MTLTRLLPLELHVVLEALTAPAIIAMPFVLGFPGAALVGAMLIGALVMGSALQGSGRAARVSAHLGLDLLVATAAGGFAVGLALAGDLGAAIFFAAVTAVQALLSVSTRYTATRAAN